MTSFNWMEESRSIGDYAPQQYVINLNKKIEKL